MKIQKLDYENNGVKLKDETLKLIQFMRYCLLLFYFF